MRLRMAISEWLYTILLVVGTGVFFRVTHLSVKQGTAVSPMDWAATLVPILVGFGIMLWHERRRKSKVARSDIARD